MNDAKGYRFTLYVSRKTDAIDELIETLQREMEAVAQQGFVLEVVNVMEMPELAANADVFVTPTLVRDLPEPVRRIIGNLKDTGKVILAMNMPADGEEDRNVII